MSVQQEFAEMIGKKDLTLEKDQLHITQYLLGISGIDHLHQVYAHLKHLEFSITSTTPPSPSYFSAQHVSNPI